VGSAAAGAARGPEKQAERQTHQQEAKTVVDDRVAMAEASGKEREHEAGREAETTGGMDAAGDGIELAATKQAHGKLLQKI